MTGTPRLRPAGRRLVAPVALVATLLAALLAALSPVAAEDPAGRPVPHPSLAPDDVVRTQVEALGANDEPYGDRGIEITWNFASPANKRMTGPLARFKRMIRLPAYAPMVNHRGAEYRNLEIAGDEARLDVILRARDGDFVGYHFALSRYRSETCDGCWMTDSVRRFAVTVH